MEQLEILRWVLVGAVFALVLSIGLAARPRDVMHLLRDHGEGRMALLAMFVAAPVIGVTLALMMPAPPPVRLTLAVLSFAPMRPGLPRSLAKLGMPERYCVSLDVLAAVVALIVAPLFLLTLKAAGLVSAAVDFDGAFFSLLRSVFLPLLLGISMHHFAPALAGRLREPLAKAASLVLIACALILIVALRDLILAQLQVATVLAIALFLVLGLGVGHWLGRNRPSRQAAALTIVSRHAGFTIAVAGSVLPDALGAILGTVAIYSLLQIAVVSLYVRRFSPAVG